MSDTPETDAALYPMNQVDIVWPDFARRLERERDEAREKYDTLAVENMLEVNKLCKERDEWAAMCGRYKQERDEARDIIRKAKAKFCEDGEDGKIASEMFSILIGNI